MNARTENLAGGLAEAVFDATPAGCLVVDEDGAIAQANRAVEEMLGYERGELVGLNVERLVPEALREEHARLRASFARAPATRPMGQGRDLLARRKDGTFVAVEIGLRHFEAAGRRFVAASLLDNRPRQSTVDRFRAAIEAAPAGILVVGATGRIALVNREIERIFGYDRDELHDEPVEVLVAEAARGIHGHQRERFLAAPSTRPMGAGRELLGRRKDGSLVDVEVGLSAIQTDEGPIVVATVLDVTERRALERRLIDAEKMEALGVMAGGVAHDFNNILLAIHGYSELIRLSVTDSEVRNDIGHVLEAAERGQRLVERILTFARRPALSKARGRLDNVAREAIALMKRTLPPAVELRAELDPATPVVRCDETELHQVCMNLLVNAGHAMGRGPGVLTLRVDAFDADEAFAAAHPGTTPGRYGRLVVSDTGAGMPEHVLARVFEPFFTTKPAGGGTGLGLCVVHGIVRSHRGAIALRSKPGEGTVAEVYFPAVDGEAPALVRPDGGARGPTA